MLDVQGGVVGSLQTSWGWGRHRMGYLQGNGHFSGKQQWAEDLGLGGGCKACMNGLWEPQSRGSTWGAGQD